MSRGFDGSLLSEYRLTWTRRFNLLRSIRLRWRLGIISDEHEVPDFDSSHRNRVQGL